MNHDLGFKNEGVSFLEMIMFWISKLNLGLCALQKIDLKVWELGSVVFYFLIHIPKSKIVRIMI